MMRLPVRLGMIITALGLIFSTAGCGSTGATPSAAATDSPVSGGMKTATPVDTPVVSSEATPITQEMKTARYKVTLAIGPPVPMWTLEQAKGEKSGEVITEGQMAPMPMSSGMRKLPVYHIDVYVSDVASGSVITDKAVTINLTNDATKDVIPVPAATMHRIEKGVSDTHFGNSVVVTPGSYTVVVGVADEKAIFHVDVLPLSGLGGPTSGGTAAPEVTPAMPGTPAPQ